MFLCKANKILACDYLLKWLLKHEEFSCWILETVNKECIPNMDPPSCKLSAKHFGFGKSYKDLFCIIIY